MRDTGHARSIPARSIPARSTPARSIPAKLTPARSIPVHLNGCAPQEPPTTPYPTCAQPRPSPGPAPCIRPPCYSLQRGHAGTRPSPASGAAPSGGCLRSLAATAASAQRHPATVVLITSLCHAYYACLMKPLHPYPPALPLMPTMPCLP